MISIARLKWVLVVGTSAIVLGACGGSNPGQIDLPAQKPPLDQAPGSTTEADIFPDELLTQYSTWNPVSRTNQAFVSQGHQGMYAKAFFNDAAKPTYEGTGAIALPEGSILAKAVLMDKDAPLDQAPKVFFMRKMPSGYDATNGDWAFGTAMMKDGKYQWTDRGKVAMCASCHQNYRDSDFALTVKLYRDHSVP